MQYQANSVAATQPSTGKRAVFTRKNGLVTTALVRGQVSSVLLLPGSVLISLVLIGLVLIGLRVT